MKMEIAVTAPVSGRVRAVFVAREVGLGLAVIDPRVPVASGETVGEPGDSSCPEPQPARTAAATTTVHPIFLHILHRIIDPLAGWQRLASTMLPCPS